jgi:AraC-like DNA-binding protein
VPRAIEGTNQARLLDVAIVGSCGSSYGLSALLAELADEGVATTNVLEGTGISPSWFTTPASTLSYSQRLTVLRNSQRYSKFSDLGLRAGRRQRISDFGLFGYGVANSRTLGDGLKFAFRHLEIAGSFLRITFERQGEVGIFRSHCPEALGALLPFVAEFWRSSVSALMADILECPFPSLSMHFPFEAPSHARAYADAFCCPISFGSDAMEWRFDAAVLEAPSRKASASTADICQRLCEAAVTSAGGQTPFQREVRAQFLAQKGYPNAADMATRMGMSLRTFHRRLAAESTTFQRLLDNLRAEVAIEYLENTILSVEEIAHRLAFSETSNFLKAFRRWTGRAPSTFRLGRRRRPGPR